MGANMTEKIKYKFVGTKWDGGLPGIPARDLTAADIKAWNIDTKTLDESSLYKKVAVKGGSK
jgi:hypothetical protein